MGDDVSQNRRDRLVYSSQHGRVCAECERPEARCSCGDRRDRPRGGAIRVRREKKGRRGKTVTTVRGVPLDRGELAALAAELKRRCGSGGSVVNDVIEIQGDHCDALIEALAERGYAAKRAGG